MTMQRMMMTSDTTRQGRDIVFISFFRMSRWKVLVLTGWSSKLKFELTEVRGSSRI